MTPSDKIAVGAFIIIAGAGLVASCSLLYRVVWSDDEPARLLRRDIELLSRRWEAAYERDMENQMREWQWW